MADSIYSVLKSREGGQNPYQGINLIGSGSLTYSVTGNPKLDSKRMTLTYRIATPALDREREIVLPAGVNCEHHKKNPIVLFDHQHHLPVGLSQDPDGNYTTVVAGDCLESTVWLSQKSKLSEEVYYLAENGLLNGASIGFTVQPGGERIATDESGNKIVVVERCDMHEWSTVWIPMNPDALKLGCEIVQKGFGRKRLSADVVRLYSPFMVKSPEWSNGFSVDKKAEFKEEDHPRDGGKFASKPGSDKEDNEDGKNDKKDDKKESDGKESGSGSEKGEKIGTGSTGDVYKVGDKVVKTATENESNAYKLLAGVDGVAPGKTVDGKIVTPFYKNIVSVDTIPPARRASLAPVVRDAYPTIVNAITHLSEVGLSYNDPLQVGFDKDKKPHLFDFSMAAKSDTEDATGDNLGFLSDFAKKFGLVGLGEKISRVSSIRHVLMHHDNPFMEDDPEMPEAKKLLDKLDGKPAKYFYFSTNGREIPKIAQTEPRDGIKVIASGEPLDAEFMKQWEITPVVHKTQSDNGDKSKNASCLVVDKKQSVWKLKDALTLKHNDRNRGDSMSRRIKGMEEEQETVVDPIQDDAVDEGPVVPLGAQYLMGLHDYAMKAAEFLTENAGSMEPETAGKFVEVEKSLMNTVKVIASTFNERYPDLPPLDGADYEEPLGEDEKGDMDAEDQIDEQVDEVETDEVDKAADDADLEADSVEGEDGELDEEDSELEEKAIGEDDDEFAEDEENDEYEKSARIALGMRAKAMLFRHQERKRIEAEAKTKVPDSAVEVVKSAASLLKEISRNVGFGPLVRQKSKHQYQQLLKCLSVDNVSTKSVILSGGLDFDEIAKKLSEIEGKFLAVKADSDTLGSRIEGVK